jgi:DNA-binding transcriptional MerR regulator
MAHTVGEVARMSGTTVRTLHHYDHLGLVSPSGRSESGYRLYSRADLERLQEVLLLREVEVPLDRIAEVLSEGVERAAVLARQRVVLERRRERLTDLIATIDQSLRGDTMSDRELFGGFDPAEYEEEAKERWGETDAYRESARRTSSYTKEDWARQQAEMEDIESSFADALRAGLAADGPEAVALAERARLHIDRWFYPCSTEMHAMVAEGYVTDPRFTAHYDDREPGLARYVRDAVVANR